MAQWRFAVGPASGSAPEGEITAAASRRYKRRLDSPDEASFTVNARLPGLPDLTELETDLWVYRDGVAVSRLRIVNSTDDIGADAHTVTLTARGYEAILDARYTEVGDALSWSAEDQATILWDLVALTQGRSNGDLGITQGTVYVSMVAQVPYETGVVRDRNYDPDQNIGKLMRELSKVIDGFDYTVNPDLTLDVWYPGRDRTAANPVLLQHGGNVRVARRSITSTSVANAVGAVGRQNVTTPEYVESTGILTDPRGRWETRISYPSVVEQTTLQEKAEGALAARERPGNGWSLTLKQGGWGGFDHVDVGDTCRFLCSSPPRLSVSELGRATEVGISIGPDDDEVVSIKLDPEVP